MLKQKHVGCVDWKDALELTKRARANGGQAVTMLTTEWDIAGSCDDPRPVEVKGRMYAEHAFLNEEWNLMKGLRTNAGALPRTVYLKVPCKKCRSCINFRAYTWRNRMTDEISHAPRTWFGTLTLSPSEQYNLLVETSARLRNGGTDFFTLSAEDKFKERCKTFHSWVQKYLKRVRKRSKCRYIVVYERHQSGNPHGHILVHEYGNGDLKKAWLSSRWQAGFSKFKLVDERDQITDYLAKYLTKDNHRLRASFRYGAEGVAFEERSKRRTSLVESVIPSVQEEKTTTLPIPF